MGEFRYVGTDKLKTMARQACRQAVRESARELKPAVIADTPKLTGELAGSTRIEGPRSSGDTVIAIVRQGEPVDYGAVVHQNWSGQMRTPARQVQIPLLRHRLRHLELLRVAGRRIF